MTLALLHGQIFAFIPAGGFFWLAAIMLACVWRSKRARQLSFWIDLSLLLGIWLGLVGLCFSWIFVDEILHSII